MTARDYATELAALERDRDATETRIAGLEAELGSLVSRHAALVDLHGVTVGGDPLPMRSLHAAFVGVVAANGCAFNGFAVYASRMNAFWNALFVVCVVVTGASLRWSGQPGAGGRARPGLRAITFFFFAVGLLEALAAAFH